MIDPVRSVDFVCRGGKATEVECVSLLNTVMSLWRDMLDRYSPGSEYETKYLSRKHLEEHKELKQVAAYSEDEMKEAKASKEGTDAIVMQILDDERIEETLGDLLVVLPYPVAVHLSPVVNAVVKHGSSQWYIFGLKLGINHNEITALCDGKVTPAAKLHAIIQAAIERVGDVKKMDDLLLEDMWTVAKSH